MKTTLRHLTMVFLGAVLLGFALAGPAAIPSAAATSADKARFERLQEQLSATRAAIEAAKLRESELGTEVAAFDARLAVLNEALVQIDARVDVARRKLDKARDRLRSLRRDLERKSAELAETEAELKSEQALFEGRVEAMYKKGDVSYLDVLIGSSGWEDLVSRIELVRTLAESDNDIVGRLTELREKVAAQKAALAADEAEMAAVTEELKTQHDKLAALRAEAAAKQARVAAARAAKNGVLQEVATNRAAWEAQEDELLAQSQRLAAVIAGAGGSGKGTGQMIWPVNGAVTSPFGWRVHPIFKVRKFHTGIDIAAGSGTAIAAADSGSVIFAGWMTGYGNVVVIDHGKGISTLYAHMSSIGAGNGSAVTRGQTVGAVGSTGYSTGPHLHFEVRVGGQPVDPLGYLP